MREYHASGEGKGMCTGRPGWQVFSELKIKMKITDNLNKMAF